VNVPFDGDVEYLFNDEVVKSKQGFITLFWACTPHQLTDALPRYDHKYRSRP